MAEPNKCLNVSSLKDALGKLREINWLYADVDVSSIDDASKQIVESVSDTTSNMLQMVSSDDVKEDALSNRLKHMDVLCFPTLFPSGKFGEGHTRDIHISSSEIVKSCLLNKDGRFRNKQLRRNIDTRTGLVNGAVGTVIAIKAHHITVQFDGRHEPYHVERVKSRFMVMKKMYVHRKQFPLILAFAVTVHKCQGLSLDCAIMDLSDQVFCLGMVYI